MKPTCLLAILLVVQGLVSSTSAVTIPAAAPIMAVPQAVSNGGVLLFNINGTGPLTGLPQIPANPATALNNPITATFNHNGELFIGNRHAGTPDAGSIARFAINPDGSFTPNGTITGNGLANVHGMAFNANGELFAANYFGSQISRFTFDSSGAAVPNGTLSLPDGDAVGLGVAFSPWGELFVASGSFSGNVPGEIDRYVFDASGTPTFNGSFVPAVVTPHFLAFSPSGELFVPGNQLNQGVAMYGFDASHQPIPNGLIPIAGGAVGVAFDQFGEIFVTSQSQFVDGGSMYRFLSNPDGSVTPNGHLDLGPIALGGVAIFPIPEPSSLVLAALGLIGLAAYGWRRKR